VVGRVLVPGLAARRAARVALALVLSSLARPAPAEPSLEPPIEVSARLVCPQRPGPGRVVCEAEIEIETGMLVWADVLVLEAPPFALPLRARVGPSALIMKSERRQRLQLALAATSAGSGELRVRARAVLCTDAGLFACRSAAREAFVRVVVGPITE
jgi:hypothetical protein